MHTTSSKKNNQIKTTSVANAVIKDASISETGLSLIDNRPEAIAQRKLKEMVINSQQPQQLKTIRALANNTSQAQQHVQLREIASHDASQQMLLVQKKSNNNYKSNEAVVGEEPFVKEMNDAQKETIFSTTAITIDSANNGIPSPKGEIIQRVETGDKVKMSDGWTRIVDETGDWMALIEEATVVVLVPTADFDSANVNTVNDMPPQYKEKGCAVCVAADYLGITAKDVAKSLDKAPPAIKGALVQIYKENGYTKLIEDLYNYLNIFLSSDSVETFENYEAMISSLTADEDGPAWTAGLAWEGHIIRASGEGTNYKFWDPQRGTNPASVPLDVPLFLIHFKI
jgi:hypothetical protein